MFFKFFFNFFCVAKREKETKVAMRKYLKQRRREILSGGENIHERRRFNFLLNEYRTNNQQIYGGMKRKRSAKLTEEEEMRIAIEKVNRPPAKRESRLDHYYWYYKGWGAPWNREELKNNKEPLQPVKIGDIVKIYGTDGLHPRAKEYVITKRKKGYSDRFGYDARFGDGYKLNMGSGWYYSLAELVFVRHGSMKASLEVEESKSSNLKF